MIAEISRQRDSYWLIGITPMSNGNAVARLVRQAASSRDQIEKVLVSQHWINPRLGNFSQQACPLRSVFGHEQRDVGAFKKAESRFWINCAASSVVRPATCVGPIKAQ